MGINFKDTLLPKSSKTCMERLIVSHEDRSGVRKLRGSEDRFLSAPGRDSETSVQSAKTMHLI